MKNKRNVLIAFILICCLCLSIGYAALTDTLMVDGTVNAKITSAESDTEKTDWEKDFEGDVHFDDSQSGQAVVGKYEVEGDKDKVTVTVPEGTFKPADGTENKGVYSVTYKVYVVNESTDFDANVTLQSTKTKKTADSATLDGHFDVSFAWDDGKNGNVVARNNKRLLNITIAMDRNNVPTTTVAEPFEITFDVAAVVQ